ncbi:MAG: bicyclomycin resistance protein [Proteobacteria bacterium]|nr:bicyclomycin resistance protein [Pseudomonadota bacterium]
MTDLRLNRRDAAAWIATPWLLPTGARAADGGPRVLRYAFAIAETGFDPAQVSDIYSRICTAHMFETMLTYDHLARPFKLKPELAEAMPEISDDNTVFTFRLKRGILFADDPAFGGKPREVTAEDFIYTLKRIYDPKLKSPGQSSLEDEGIIGLRELREAALKGQPFDYAQPVDGLQAIDRYTLRVRLRESRPRHLFNWAAKDIYGVVAREVVEAYGDRIMDHPVGTGPYRLAEWRRSSRIVFERNPRFREAVYDVAPNADDAEGQALLQRFKGRRVPMVDRVEISIIEQSQPRWLAFLSGEQNFLDRLPPDFVTIALAGSKLAPNLVKRGIHLHRALMADITLNVFNMQNSVVGGYAPAQIALRRAMALGDSIEREIRLLRYGQAIPAQSIVPPLVLGYDPELHTENSVFDPARAKALLDVYGYVDRDGDGWRERPDGSPMTLVMNTQPDPLSRAQDGLWKKSMDALGLRVELKNAQWPENLKAALAGNFMMWRVASLASSPDGLGALERAYGPSIGKGNIARMQLPAFDDIYRQLKFMPDGPARQAKFDEAAKLLVAYAPYRAGVHRIANDMSYAEVQGYRRTPFWLDWWQFVDVAPSAA